MSEPMIRPIREEDVSQIHEIEKACFAMPWSEESILHDVKENVVARWLVLDDGEGNVLAYAGMWFVLDEGHITNIAVRKDYRGQGIGRLLTAGLMQYAANLGVTYMTLEVRRSNETAQNLYRSLGFIQVGVRKKYYEDNGEDALFMVCDHMPPAQEDFEEPETVRE